MRFLPAQRSEPVPDPDPVYRNDVVGEFRPVGRNDDGVFRSGTKKGSLAPLFIITLTRFTQFLPLRL